MDCKDLMIGDWVCRCGWYNKVIYIGEQVTLCDDNGTKYTTEPHHLRPVELTEEILVKNGFEKQGDLYQYHINVGNGYTRIDIIDLQDGLWSYDIDVYDKFADAHKIHHDDDCFLKLHQLQHLLRLAGVQKEIEL